MATVGSGRTTTSPMRPWRLLARATVEPVAQHHGEGAEEEGGAEEDLDVVLGAVGVAEEVERRRPRARAAGTEPSTIQPTSE